ETAPALAKAAGLYMICTISKHIAERKGYADAMMLDWQGRVAECTGANIFFISDGKIHTPIADCFLAGITRSTVIELAKKRGIEVIERRIMPDELTQFSECFITGSAAEVTAVAGNAHLKFTPAALTQPLNAHYPAEVPPRGTKEAARRGRAGRIPSIAAHHQPVGAGFPAPRFARSAQHLAHIRVFLVAGKGGVGPGLGIETLHGVGRPISRPHPIPVVDIDRIGAPFALRHRISRPSLGRRVIAPDRSPVPEAHPQHAFGIRPDAARPDARLRWFHHRDCAGRRIDLCNMIAGERCVPDVARRCR